MGIGQKLVAKRRPTRVERHRRADLVEHLDPGRKPCLDRVFGEQALGKRMERADGRAVELLQGLAGAVPPVAVGVRLGCLLQLGPNPIAQLGSRLLGEGDRRDTPELDVAAQHQRQDPLHQGRCLPRSRTGLDKQRRLQVAPDPLASRLVGWRWRSDGHLLRHRGAAPLPHR